MNGGKMYQDVDGHAIGGTHRCYDGVTKEWHNVTSTHHQMMKPSARGNIIAHGDEAHDVIDVNDGEFMNIGDINSVEVVWYEDTSSLCFQPHPEFYGADSTREYYFELLGRYLGFKQ
jgi:hypothetical protein